MPKLPPDNQPPHDQRELTIVIAGVERRITVRVDAAGCMFPVGRTYRSYDNRHYPVQAGRSRRGLGRLLYEAHHGSLDKSVILTCSCGHPDCVAPAHQQVTSMSAVVTGRPKPNNRGEKNGRAKLDLPTARLIRQTPGSHSEVADLFCVNRKTVRLVRANLLWAEPGSP